MVGWSPTDLDAVVEVDQAVVAGVRHDVVLVHDEGPGRRHCQGIAAACLEAQAQLRARGLAHRPGADAAAAVEVPLCAHTHARTYDGGWVRSRRFVRLMAGEGGNLRKHE